MIPTTPTTILAALIVAVITILCINAHDRIQARRMRSHNRLADLCRNLLRTLDDTREDQNQ